MTHCHGKSRRSVAPLVGFTLAMPAIAEEAPAVAQTEDQRIADFFEEVFQRNVKDSPIFQAQLGIKGPDYGKWNDFTDAEAIRQNDLTRQDLERLRAEFKYAALSPKMKVSYRIFECRRSAPRISRGASITKPFRPNRTKPRPSHVHQNLHRGMIRGRRGYISR